MSIIVDGYNYIGRSTELTLQDTHAREKIIYLFGQYCARAKKTLTLVFDGSFGGQQVDRKRQYGRVTVIYTSPIYSADHAIKKMVVAQEPRRRKALLVVSSDGDVAEYVRTHGTPVIKSEEFEQQIFRTLSQEQQLDRVNIRVSDEEVLEWLKLFGPEPVEQKKPEKQPDKSGQPATRERATRTATSKNAQPEKSPPAPRMYGADDDERRDHIRLSPKEVDEWMKIFGGDDDE